MADEDRQLTLPGSPPARKQPRPRDPLWDVLERELGPVATRSERGRRNGVVKQLREVNATAAQVEQRIASARASWSVPVTDAAIAANWTVLGTDDDEDSRQQAAEGRRRLEETWSKFHPPKEEE